MRERTVLEVVSQVVPLRMRPLHVELHGFSDIHEGVCPLCDGRLVVLPRDERWICYSCLYGGTGEAGIATFRALVESGTRKQRLSWEAFTLKNAGL